MYSVEPYKKGNKDAGVYHCKFFFTWTTFAICKGSGVCKSVFVNSNRLRGRLVKWCSVVHLFNFAPYIRI